MQLTAPHPPEECRRLLQAHTDGPYTLRGTSPVIGRIGPTRIRLRKRIRYRNSFQTILTADITAQGSHTILNCRFGQHLFVVIFLAAWFAAIIAVLFLVAGAALFVLADAPQAATRSTWMALLVPLAMLAGGAGLLALGRYLARNEARFLADFLRTALGARDASS